MSSYILVHGAWHGAWCWEKVIPLLAREGHEVHAPDLPGHGEDRTALSEVSLDTYVDQVGQSLADSSEPAILVGHSLAGAIISQAAERFPHLIGSLVYLTAFLLKDGQSRRQLPDVGVSLVQQNLIFGHGGSSVTVGPRVRIEAFYGDCSKADAQKASTRLTPEPFAPLITPLSITEERFGRVPRVYIECLRDRAIPLELQRIMQAALPCQQVTSMDTSHSPFLSAPEKLAGNLLSIEIRHAIPTVS